MALSLPYQDLESFRRALVDIANYLYVNDGVLRDRAFLDLTKFLALKSAAAHSNLEGLLEPESLSNLDEKSVVDWAQTLSEAALDQGFAEPGHASWSIKPKSLLRVAQDLAEFDLTSLPIDAKGEAFQALVSSGLKGGRGEYYTPNPLVGAVAKLATLAPHTRVIDPACGTGGFLYEAYRQGVCPENLFGFEVNPDVAIAARTRLHLIGAAPTQVENIDALANGLVHAECFDAVLMNPPFGARSKIDNANTLGKYELPFMGREGLPPRPLPPEILFLELATRLLRPGGFLGAVVPDGLLQNPSALYVRNWLFQKNELLAVISCPAVTFQVFGTGIKTSLLIMQRRSSAKQSKTYFAISKSIGYDARGNVKLRSVNQQPSFESKNHIDLIDQDLPSIILEALESRKTRVSKEWSYGWMEDIQTETTRWDAEYYTKPVVERRQAYLALRLPKLRSIADLIATEKLQYPINSLCKYIELSDIDPLSSQIRSHKLVFFDRLPSRAKHLVSEGNVLTAISGASTGTAAHVSAIIPQQLSGAIASSGFAMMKGVAISKFQLLGYLRSNMFLAQALQLRTGHAIPALRLQDLLDVVVPPPSSSIWGFWEASMRRLTHDGSLLYSLASSQRLEGSKILSSELGLEFDWPS